MAFLCYVDYKHNLASCVSKFFESSLFLIGARGFRVYRWSDFSLYSIFYCHILMGILRCIECDTGVHVDGHVGTELEQ